MNKSCAIEDKLYNLYKNQELSKKSYNRILKLVEKIKEQDLKKTQ